MDNRISLEKAYQVFFEDYPDVLDLSRLIRPLDLSGDKAFTDIVV